MKRLSNRILMLVLLAFASFASVQAQFTTTFAKNAAATQNNGLFYSLPLTMLQLDFTILETEVIEGPLSDYASSFIETSDYVDYSGKEYKLLCVDMKLMSCADPNATFFVSFSSGRGSEKTSFNVLPNGIIRSVGIDDVEETAANQEVGSEKVIYSEEPTFIGILTNGKSQSMIAKEVADKIEEIRKAKFNIISGYYETALDPLTLQKMYDELDTMEKEYTSLFVGKRIGKQVVKTVYVTPSKEVATQTVAKFSEEDGLSASTSGVGNPITVQTLSMNATSNISTLSQSALESMSHENKVFYRIPETANVKVMCDNQVLIEKREVVNQLGVLLLAPVSNMGLLFDSNTGQIVNMKMK